MGDFSLSDVNQARTEIVHPERSFSLVDFGMIQTERDRFVRMAKEGWKF